jgi:hypothetical protein
MNLRAIEAKGFKKVEKQGDLKYLKHGGINLVRMERY